MNRRSFLSALAGLPLISRLDLSANPRLVGLLPSQRTFMLANPDGPLFWLGGYGSGGTTAGAMRCMRLSVCGQRGLVLRRFYPDMERDTKEIIQKSWNRVGFTPNAFLRFATCSDPAERKSAKILAETADYIWVECAEELDAKTWRWIASLGRPIFATCHVDERAHWLRHQLALYGYVHASTFDNPHLSADLKAAISNGFPTEWVEKHAEAKL